MTFGMIFLLLSVLKIFSQISGQPGPNLSELHFTTAGGAVSASKPVLSSLKYVNWEVQLNGADKITVSKLAYFRNKRHHLGSAVAVNFPLNHPVCVN